MGAEGPGRGRGSARGGPMGAGVKGQQEVLRGAATWVGAAMGKRPAAPGPGGPRSRGRGRDRDLSPGRAEQQDVPYRLRELLRSRELMRSRQGKSRRRAGNGAGAGAAHPRNGSQPGGCPRGLGNGVCWGRVWVSTLALPGVGGSVGIASPFASQSGSRSRRPRTTSRCPSSSGASGSRRRRSCGAWSRRRGTCCSSPRTSCSASPRSRSRPGRSLPGRRSMSGTARRPARAGGQAGLPQDGGVFVLPPAAGTACCLGAVTPGDGGGGVS